MGKKIELTDDLLDMSADIQKDMHEFIDNVYGRQKDRDKNMQYSDAVTMYLLMKLSEMELRLSKLEEK